MNSACLAMSSGVWAEEVNYSALLHKSGWRLLSIDIESFASTSQTFTRKWIKKNCFSSFHHHHHHPGLICSEARNLLWISSSLSATLRWSNRFRCFFSSKIKNFTQQWLWVIEKFNTEDSDFGVRGEPTTKKVKRQRFLDSRRSSEF